MLNGMHLQLRALCSLGPKPCGSVANAEAAKYLYSASREFCPDCYLDEFNFSGWENLGESRLEILAPYRTTLSSLVFLGSGGGAFEGELHYVGLNHVWNIYSWDRYVIRSQGRIVAYISGRIGGDLLSQTLVEENCALPHMIVGQADNEQLQELLRRGERVIMRGFANCTARENMRGINIVLPYKAKKALHKPIVITTHRDTMYNTPGAYDNQSGCVVMLSLASKLREMQLERDITLVFTDGEECRLAGGRHMAAQYHQEDLAYMINIDGVGGGSEMEIWCGPDWFERRVMQVLLSDASVQQQCYRNPPPPGSDHAPFYDKGIPSVMLTFNNQAIIHTPQDDFSEHLLPNMQRMCALVLKLLSLDYQEE